MGLVNLILKSALKRRITQIQHTLQNPLEVQLKLLMHLIKKSKNTEWGRKYDYASITTLADFKARVPISSYEDIFPIIERALKGEQNLLWPTNISWFSKSSGTTNAKSKFIPVSKESLQQCHYKGGKDLLSLYFNNNPDSKLFDGRGLGIGGSLKPNNKFRNSYYGDVSAVIMANLPIWAQYVRTPDIETALMSEWEEKLEKIAQRTLKENVTNISGVPTWTVVLIERMLELSGKDNMLEIWPKFEVFFHGAVSFTPYRQLFKNFLPSQDVHYVETYNASEGFFGIQDRLGADDMLLMLDYGVFYEFLPASEADNEATEAI
ncbi:MAG TPA: GH3 auxin-responsive promoter family protein, partial [Cytophagaceae bacterium]